MVSRISRILFSMVLIMGATSAMAQKQFTLEDLNFGGKNYRQMSPQNRTLYWWGDKLVHATDSLCSLVDVNTAKEKPLFTLDQMREWSELGKKLRCSVACRCPTLASLSRWCIPPRSEYW